MLITVCVMVATVMHLIGDSKPTQALSYFIACRSFFWVNMQEKIGVVLFFCYTMIICILSVYSFQILLLCYVVYKVHVASYNNTIIIIMVS